MFAHAEHVEADVLRELRCLEHVVEPTAGVVIATDVREREDADLHGEVLAVSRDAGRRR
jgi:hypothetical protein